MRVMSVMLFAAMLAGCAAPSADLPVQQSVDLKQYAGTWYEQARLPNRFQKECVGDVQADYVLRADGTLGVTNRCRVTDGSTKTAQGEGRLAKAADRDNPARLEVRFAPAWTSWLPMVWGDYWILKLEDDYQYSLVGTPDRKYLWVLSREKSADPAVVSRLLEYARTLDFPVDEVTRSAQ